MFRINFKPYQPCMNKCTEWIGTVGFQHNPAQCPFREINQLQNDKFSEKSIIKKSTTIIPLLLEKKTSWPLTCRPAIVSPSKAFITSPLKCIFKTLAIVFYMLWLEKTLKILGFEKILMIWWEDDILEWITFIAPPPLKRLGKMPINLNDLII